MVELIKKPNELAKRIGPRARVFTQALFAKAEEAFRKIARSFPGWLKADIAALEKARAALGEAPSEAAIKELHHCARCLRGSGSTFGYPVISSFADSLCALSQQPPVGKRWRELIDAHVDAISAALRDNVRTAKDGAAAGLMQELSVQASDKA